MAVGFGLDGVDNPTRQGRDGMVRFDCVDGSGCVLRARTNHVGVAAANIDAVFAERTLGVAECAVLCVLEVVVATLAGLDRERIGYLYTVVCGIFRERLGLVFVDDEQAGFADVDPDVVGVAAPPCVDNGVLVVAFSVNATTGCLPRSVHLTASWPFPMPLHTRVSGWSTGNTYMPASASPTADSTKLGIASRLPFC